MALLEARGGLERDLKGTLWHVALTSTVQVITSSSGDTVQPRSLARDHILFRFVGFVSTLSGIGRPGYSPTTLESLPGCALFTVDMI